MPLAIQTTTTLLFLIILFLIILYHKALPKPNPGIHYDKGSARRLWGDIPDALAHHAKTGESYSSLTKKCIEMQEPIFQVFMRPAQDLMTRRTREFDRSDFARDVLIALFPMEQAVLYTNDQWRFNRKLMADAMKPEFLNQVAAPEVYNHTLDMITLWRGKMRLAEGRAFDVLQDVQMCTVDTIWAVAFGMSIGACRAGAEQLRSVERIAMPEDADAVVAMPEADLPGIFHHLKAIVESCEIPISSPFGRWHHWFAVNFYPSLRRAIKARDEIVNTQITQAWKIYDEGGASKNDVRIKCALNLIVERESSLARKEGRKPDRYSRVLFDELAGFLNAGFGTTSSTDVQRKLRQSLRAVHGEAVRSGRMPQAEEITRETCHYLDAFIDEVLRHSAVVPLNIRVATTDVPLLGHVVPKGVDVFMLANGPSMTSPAFPIDELKRTTTSRELAADADRWCERSDMGEFVPERWLVVDEKGQESFDNRAAPLQSFGAGIRGCYGKRLAYLEMRIIYTLIVWNLEILPLPSELEEFKSRDVFTHNAQNVRVRLAPAK
ncbi:Putative cytochrome P450 [Septoria linicola]|uniref:Cytochrome P450 n=1 Tax=Septoria linicola TaxID=215465 RepID=A0A9Q9AQ50_9PEZI|nr:Putative cytochrome P450 [Septoria linicola]